MLNNKGFAITGILYTLFILFSLVLVSVLAGLSSRLSFLEKSVVSLEDDYKLGEEVSVDVSISEAPVDGKYVFTYNGNRCYTYLKKGTDLTYLGNLVFTSLSCSGIEDGLTLESYFPFLRDENDD